MTPTGSDADVLSWGFRSRLALLMVLVVSALGAALWSGLRDEGIGEPDDRRKVLVVTQPGSDADYHAVLERGGFVIEVGELADWESDARLQMPESEAQGVALLLEYADLRGFGFVVFEEPAKLDFNGLELEPPIEDIEQLDARDHVSISVGDLAFPHRLGVDDIGDPPRVRMPGYGALQAMFAQPAVHAREDDDRPTVAELQYEAALDLGRRMYERPGTFEQSIANARAAIDERLAVDASVRTLVGPFMTGSAVPTPEGVLLVQHGLDIYSDDARTLEQRAGETMHFEWLDDAAQASELRTVPCPSLAGGSLDMRRGPQIEAAIDGSALSISMRDEPTVVWRKLAQPGCSWIEHTRIADASRLAIGSRLVLAPRFPGWPDESTRSIVAEFGIDDVESAIVRLWPASSPNPRELLRLPEGNIDAVAFIDDVHLVALSRVPLPSEEQISVRAAEQALHVLDRRRPGVHLRVASEFFAGGRSVREVAVVEPATAEHGPRFALTLVDNGVDTELVILTIGATAWQRFMQGEQDAELFTLTPEELELRGLGRAPAIAALSVGPKAVVYALADGVAPAEITVRDLDGGGERRLTHNELVDTLPRWTADGRAVVFVTGVRSSLSNDPFSVPRIAWIE